MQALQYRAYSCLTGVVKNKNPGNASRKLLLASIEPMLSRIYARRSFFSAWTSVSRTSRRQSPIPNPPDHDYRGNLLFSRPSNASSLANEYLSCNDPNFPCLLKAPSRSAPVRPGTNDSRNPESVHREALHQGSSADESTDRGGAPWLVSSRKLRTRKHSPNSTYSP